MGLQNLDKLKKILIHLQMDEESLHPKTKYAPRALRLLFQEIAFHFLLGGGVNNVGLLGEDDQNSTL